MKVTIADLFCGAGGTSAGAVEAASRLGYRFTGTKKDQVKQIGNAVPRRLARAIVGAVLSQNSNVSALVDAEEGKVNAA